jgi:N-acetylglucosamine kinase-like BadF-type ATPase
MIAILGVDGGGTKTHAVVADEAGRVLGTAVHGPSNWEDVGLARAADSLERAVRIALSEARVLPQELAASVFGLAGIDWESDELRIATILTPLGLGGRRRILNDAFIALRAGASESYGVVVVAGTGSICAGRNRSGEEFRTLGLGPYFGDYGGGSDISESALQAVAEAYVGKRPATALSDLLCEHVRVRTVGELLEVVAREQDDLPYIAKGVMEVAEAGDPVAASIIQRAGTHLAANAVLVARGLGMVNEVFDLVLAGGLLQAPTRLLIDPLIRSVRQAAPGVRPVHLTTPPVIGAVALALEEAGVDVDVDVYACLEAGMSEPLRAVPAERL